MGVFDLIPYSYYLGGSKPNPPQQSSTSGGSYSSGSQTTTKPTESYDASYQTSASKEAEIRQTILALQAKLPKGSVVSYSPRTKTLEVTNPNAPVQTRSFEIQNVDIQEVAQPANVAMIQKAAETYAKGNVLFQNYQTPTNVKEIPGGQTGEFPIFGYSKEPAPAQKTPLEASMVSKTGYKLEYRAYFPTQTPVEKFLTSTPEGKRNVIMPEIRLDLRNYQGPFFMGASEQVGTKTEQLFKTYEKTLEAYPPGIKEPVQMGTAAVKFLFADIPRFATKYGEAIRMKGEEQLASYANPRQYVKEVLTGRRGSPEVIMGYRPAVEKNIPYTPLEKLGLFGREEVAPAIAMYGLITGSVAASKIVWKAAPKLGVILKPSEKVYATDRVSFGEALKADVKAVFQDIRFKATKPIMAENIGKTQYDLTIEKERILQAQEMLKQQSTAAVELYGAESRALTDKSFRFKVTVPREMVRTYYQTKLATGELVEIVNPPMGKGKVKLPADLIKEMSFSETELSAKIIFQSQKKMVTAEGIKPAGEVKLVDARLQATTAPKGKPFEDTRMLERLNRPEIENLFTLGRAARSNVLKDLIPKPEIPGLTSPYDITLERKPFLKTVEPFVKKKMETIELTMQKLFTEGTRITLKGKEVFKGLFERGKSEEIKLLPETYKVQKFARARNLLESGRVTYRSESLERYLKAQEALGEKYKAMRKLAPTESKPLFRDIVEFEKLGQVFKKTPLKYEAEKIKLVEPERALGAQAENLKLKKPVLKKPVIIEQGYGISRKSKGGGAIQVQYPPMEKIATEEQVIIPRLPEEKAGPSWTIEQYRDFYARKFQQTTKEKLIDIPALARITASALGINTKIGLLDGIKASERLTPISILKEIIIPSFASKQKVGLTSRITESSLTTTLQKTFTIFIPKTTSIEKSATGEAEIQQLKLKQRTEFKALPGFPRFPGSRLGGKADIGDIEIIKPKPTRLSAIGEDLLMAGITKKRPGYDVYAKEKGKFVKLNEAVLTLESALALGGEAVDNTASATFKVKKSNKKGVPGNEGGYFPEYKFKKKRENTYQEKNKFRIDTEGELRGITVKGWKAKRTKRLKL